MFWSIILSLFCLFKLCYSEDIIVNIENGKVKGKVIYFHNKTIDEFLGIRYGKPPIGSLRFKRPEKVDNWTDIYDATTKKNVCWQNNNDKQMNEDCLFLNVWAPHNSSKSKSVMFWIHGGGLQSGSIFDDMLNGTPLALFDVVVVSVNYRLGPMGFLYGGSEEAPGNVGLYDQLLALKWVKRNIHVFGGDHNDVTIFGQSAGGWSVSLHILSPLSKGLFKKAIIQSGTILTDIGYRDKKESLNYTKEFSQRLGCKTNQTNWITCLKHLNASNLMDYSIDFIRFSAGFVPVFNETFYPVKPVDALKTGRFNAEVKLLTGVVADEGSNIVVNLLPFFNSSSETFREDVRNALFTFLKPWKPLESKNVRNKVLDFYLSNQTNINVLKNKFGHVFGDPTLVCPTYFMAKNMLLWSGDHKVYFYELTYRSNRGPMNRGCNQEWTGVCHSDDLPFVFGNPLINPQNYNQIDYQFSLLVMNLWTNFAKTGNPVSSISKSITLPGVHLNNVKWPTLKKTSLETVQTQVMDLNPKRFGTFLNEPFKSFCDELWKDIFKF